MFLSEPEKQEIENRAKRKDEFLARLAIHIHEADSLTKEWNRLSRDLQVTTQNKTIDGVALAIANVVDLGDSRHLQMPPPNLEEYEEKTYKALNEIFEEWIQSEDFKVRLEKAVKND